MPLVSVSTAIETGRANLWPKVIGMALASMAITGLFLFFVGIIPALAWIQGMFADFFQQVIEAHDEDFLRYLDIEP